MDKLFHRRWLFAGKKDIAVVTEIKDTATAIPAAVNEATEPDTDNALLQRKISGNKLIKKEGAAT